MHLSNDIQISRCYLLDYVIERYGGLTALQPSGTGFEFWQNHKRNFISYSKIRKKFPPSTHPSIRLYNSVDRFKFQLLK